LQFVCGFNSIFHMTQNYEMKYCYLYFLIAEYTNVYIISGAYIFICSTYTALKAINTYVLFLYSGAYVKIK